MTVETLVSASQVVGTVAVVGSLVFVGLQIRQNTKATRAQVHQDITNSYLSAARSITEHAAIFAKGIAATPESFSTLSHEEKLIYFSVIFSFFKHFENMHAQFERGLVPKDSWAAWSEHILMYYNQPGVKLWWSMRGGAFSPRFRAFLDQPGRGTLPSMVDVLHAGKGENSRQSEQK